MDPLCITVGIVGLLDVCSRLILSIRDVETSSKSIDEDLQAIASDVGAVSGASELLEQIFETRHNEISKTTEYLSFRIWEDYAQILPECEDAVST